MIGKSTPTPPAAPDPTVVAGAQTASDEATALYQSQLNNGNSSTPYGSVTNTYNPSANQWTQNTQLSPAEQNIFNQSTTAQGAALGVANDQIGRVAGALDTPLTPPTLQTGVNNGQIASGYDAGGPIQSQFNTGPALQYSVNPASQPVQGQINAGDTSQAVNNTVQSQYASMEGLLAPQQQQAAEHQNAQLVAQGLNPNDAAYQNSQTLFNNSQQQQNAQVAAQAVAAGNTEQNTLFGQAATAGQFANTAQAQEYGQNLTSGQFADTAAAQDYAQNEGASQFANTAQQQQNAQNQAQAGFGNTAQQQTSSQAAANAALYNQAADQGFQNTAYSQQQPINELDALLSSGQVQSPTAAQFSQTAVAPTDVTGAYALQQQQLNNNYQAQVANQNAGLSGLFNLGSAALSFA